MIELRKQTPGVHSGGVMKVSRIFYVLFFACSFVPDPLRYHVVPSWSSYICAGIESGSVHLLRSSNMLEV